MTSSIGARVDPLLLGEAWFTDLPGGLNRYFADLHAALGAAGSSARAVVIGPATNAPTSVVTAGELHDPLLARLQSYRRAAAHAEDNGEVDVVDAHFALYAFLSVFTTRLRHRPLIVHFQGPWADESIMSRGASWAIPVKSVVEKAMYRHADRVVVLSHAFRRLVIGRYGVDPTRVVVIPPGVDLKRFVPGERSLARDRFGIDPAAFLVVAARRLDARMGLDVLLEAWRTVQKAEPRAVLLVAGGGREHENLEALCIGLARPDGVRLLGRLTDDDLVALYQAADCSVVPSRELEGFGLVVLESLACGTPVVVTDAGGLPEAVAGLDPSLVVHSGASTALAQRLLAAASGQLPTADACRAHAENFNWSGVARRHVELYREVAARPPRRTRVVFLDHCAQLSGAELALMRLLPALDVDAHVILAENGPLVGRLHDAGVSVEVLPMAEVGRGLRRDRVRVGALPTASVYAGVAYAARIARRLRQLRPDLVHTNSLKAALYGGVAGRLARVPVVWHVHERIADDYLPAPAVRLMRAARHLLPSAVIANSNATKATLEGTNLLAPHPATVISCPVIHDSVATDMGDRSSFDGALRVGIVGRLAPLKGQHLFLEAFAHAFSDGDQRAVIVGGALFGPDEVAYGEGLRKQAAQLGLADRVEFTGHVQDVPALLARLDVLVHASTVPEGFGQVILEGMAAGLAVVAADAGGPVEIATEGVDALFYPPRDVEALAACLRRLDRDLVLRARLGEAGRARAADFTAPQVAAQVMAVYHQVRTARAFS
jgi:glycosyltransferase involved in cell wall biosynthesis